MKKIDIKLKELDDLDELKGIPSPHSISEYSPFSNYIKYLTRTLSSELKNKINFSQLSTATSLSELYELVGMYNPQLRYYIRANEYSYRGFSSLLRILEVQTNSSMNKLYNVAQDYTINSVIMEKTEMKQSYTLKFFYSEGHTFTASNVYQHAIFNSTVSYDSHKKTVEVDEKKSTSVSMEDVLYIEVQYHDGTVEVIPGMITKFKVVPNATQMWKVQTEVATTQLKAEKAAKKHISNVAKIRAKKKAQRAKDLGVTVEQLDKLKNKNK